MACPLVLRRPAAGPDRIARMGRVRARRAADLGVRQYQAGQLRTAAADIRDRRAPHVPLLRRQRGAGLRAVATAMAAGGVVGAGAAAPRAGTHPRLRLALDRRRAAVPAYGDAVPALVAQRSETGAAGGAVHRPGLAAGRLRAVFGAKHRLSVHRRVCAGPGARARVVRRLLRQRAGGDGDAGDAGPLRARAGHAQGAWYAFVAIQLVAVMRIGAEFARDPMQWQAIAAVGWLVALLPWVARIGRIYLSPRTDGKPG